MRGEDRPAALALLDQQAVLRQVLRTVHSNTITAWSSGGVCFPGPRSFDWTRNETETVATGDRTTC
nr:hypothetical protein [uncultured bacterium]